MDNVVFGLVDSCKWLFVLCVVRLVVEFGGDFGVG